MSPEGLIGVPQIEEITLRNMLPKVFVNEKIPASDVWNTEVTFKRGEKYLVEAASGAGKSSMCAYIYGARTDYEGSLIFYYGKRPRMNAGKYDMATWQSIRRWELAYLPQELDLFPELTAWENIELKNRLTYHCRPKEIEERMERLGIASRRDYPVGKLSIGQQQRVAIIRALCQPFSFILLDEPVSHLDEKNNRKVAAMIEEEAARQGACIISTSVCNPMQITDTHRLRL